MARKSQRRSTNHSILIVDDQEEILVSVRSLLEREGHSVLTASSGPRALQLFKSNEVHLLLVDYFMPGMSGEELIREIRSFDRWVQIILQTGYAGEKPAGQMMTELDIQGYHEKADGPEKLLLWIDVGLKAHRLISRLRERERLQGELIANMSHELRTPLHIINGYSDLLLQGEFGELPTEAHCVLTRIVAATSNLSEQVSDLLRFGKLEANVIEGAPRWVNMKEIGDGIERLAAMLLESSPVQFSIDIDSAPDGLITDPVKLTAILRNLVTNAVKFTTSGSIELGVRQRDRLMQFTVSDTGLGISPEHQELVFEPFRQIDGSPTRSHGGMGLGLALSRKLARVLGGDLELKSEVGAGSTFILTLPMIEDASDAPRCNGGSLALGAPLELRSAASAA